VSEAGGAHAHARARVRARRSSRLQPVEPCSAELAPELAAAILLLNGGAALQTAAERTHAQEPRRPRTARNKHSSMQARSVLDSGSASSPPRAGTLLCWFARGRNTGDRRTQRQGGTERLRVYTQPRTKKNKNVHAQGALGAGKASSMAAG